MAYGYFPNAKRGYTQYNDVATKRYVDLSNYSLNDIFEHFGSEKIENHLRKLKIKKIYG